MSPARLSAPSPAEMRRARDRAARLYTGIHFQNAYVRGASAALAGRSSDDCPYRAKRGDSSWRKGYRVAWMRGHQSITVDREEV